MITEGQKKRTELIRERDAEYYKKLEEAGRRTGLLVFFVRLFVGVCRISVWRQDFALLFVFLASLSEVFLGSFTYVMFLFFCVMCCFYLLGLKKIGLCFRTWGFQP